MRTGATSQIIGPVNQLRCLLRIHNENSEPTPNYSTRDLEGIDVPVVVAHTENDEFIEREHAEYLAETIPNARYLLVPEVSHFAPLQRPAISVLLTLGSSEPVGFVPSSQVDHFLRT